MIKYYCDRCGRFISQPKHKEVDICIRGMLTVDLCDKCTEEFDKLAIRFVKGDSEVNCESCKHSEKDYIEEPCKSCVEFGSYINFERLDEEEEEDD